MKEKKTKTTLINNHIVKFKSNQTILKYIVLYGHLGENNKLPINVIGTIFDKFYTNIKSYYGLLRKHIFARKPRFLTTDYNSIYYTYCSFKHNNKIIRLTVGDYIAENYNTLVNNNFKNINKRKYYPKSCIVTKRKKGKYTEYKKIGENKYVHKTNIVDGYYINIKIPKIVRDKTITYLQITKYNDKYKLYIMYDTPVNIQKINIPDNEKVEKSISIDTGIGNLMTIYNPTGTQNIFKGNKLLSINSFYNNKINKLKSINKKKYNKNTFNRLYSLLEERKNMLYAEINKIIDKLTDIYKDKYIFIIGYNENWKNKVNLGTSINKKFYQIPYRYILNKLRDKLEKLGKELIITEESYTSKCDALTLEEIKKKDKYNGVRKYRGLYISGNGKAINADINGAINIMRKKYDIKTITGLNLYNPNIIIV
jgi:putative transposase